MDRIVSSDWFAALWKVVCLSSMVPMYFMVNHARDHWGSPATAALIIGWILALFALAGAPFWIRWPKSR